MWEWKGQVGTIFGMVLFANSTDKFLVLWGLVQSSNPVRETRCHGWWTNGTPLCCLLECTQLRPVCNNWDATSGDLRHLFDRLSYSDEKWAELCNEPLVKSRRSSDCSIELRMRTVSFLGRVNFDLEIMREV
jgi:hypothetical protein